MRRQFIFGTMLSAVFATHLAAQQPPNAQPPAGQPPAGQPPPAGSTQPANPSDTRGQKPQTDRAAQPVTVIGCVAPASSQAGAGATTTGAQSAGYILTNVTAAGAATPGAAASGSAGRTAGTAGTATGTTLASSYRLMGGPDQDFSKYAGQRVEITATTTGSGASGSAATAPGSAPGAAAGTANPSTPGAAAGATASGAQGQGTMPSLQVTAVRPATGGGTCTQ